MDKYQKYIFRKYGITETFIFSQCCPEGETTEGKRAYSEFDEETDTFTVIQDEDITKTKYILIVDSTVGDFKPFEGVSVCKGEKQEKVPCVGGQYKITVDFSHRIEQVRFTFANEIAPEYVLKIAYKEADKEKYYARKEQERKDNLLKAASIKVSTGADLVNIYFQPCCEKYECAEVSLYIPKDYVTVGGPYGPVQKPASWSLIKRCKVPADDFYESITGLAYGTYSVVIIQYDRNGNVILETDHIEFRVKKPADDSIQGCVNVI